MYSNAFAHITKYVLIHMCTVGEREGEGVGGRSGKSQTERERDREARRDRQTDRKQKREREKLSKTITQSTHPQKTQLKKSTMQRHTHKKGPQQILHFPFNVAHKQPFLRPESLDLDGHQCVDSERHSSCRVSVSTVHSNLHRRHY